MKVHFFIPSDLSGNIGKGYNYYMSLLPNDDDWAVLLDGDTMFFHNDFEKQFTEVIKNNPGAGIITCYASRIGTHKQKFQNNVSEDPNLINHYQIANQLRQHHYSGVKTLDGTVSGFCMAVKKATWKEIPFSENIGLLGVDSDFSRRVYKSGKPILLMEGLYMLHFYRLGQGRRAGRKALEKIQKQCACQSIQNLRSDLAVVIHTCDAYMFLWEAWYYYWQKHWNVTDIPVYFMNETYLWEKPGLQQQRTGCGEWSDRLISGLNAIKENYIFYFQEDFWLTENFNNERLDDLLIKFNNHKMRALRICNDSAQFKTVNTGDERLKQFRRNSKYLVNHQASIWNKDFFIDCMAPGESPWQNEVEGTKRLHETGNTDGIYLYDCKWYEAVCRRGNLTETGLLMEKQIQL